MCLQEHRFIQEEFELTTKQQTYENRKLITCSVWKASVNAACKGIGMLFSPETYHKSVELITPRILVSKLDRNPHTTVISCYRTANVIDESEPEKFYTELEWFTRQVPKHNTLIIGGDFSAYLGQQVQVCIPPADKPNRSNAERLHARE